MPSFLDKLRSSKKDNPYLNPYHPGHQTHPNLRTTNPTSSTNPQSGSVNPNNQQRPASTLGSSDLLAQARREAGRDPVTGQRVPPNLARSATERTSLEDLRQVEQEERTAYQNRARLSKITMGSRYDLFAAQMRQKQEDEARIRAARGGLEYYAPERRFEEFYAERVRYDR